jgi:hypothetical protein
MVLGLSVLGLAPLSATAAAAPSGSLVFNGALNGTLQLGPRSLCHAGKHGVTLSNFTTTLASGNGAKWSVNVHVVKLGTYKRFRTVTDSFVIDTSGGDLWVATQGSMTVIAKSGTVNLTLSDHEGLNIGTVHVAGTWICAS